MLTRRLLAMLALVSLIMSVGPYAALSHITDPVPQIQPGFTHSTSLCSADHYNHGVQLDSGHIMDSSATLADLDGDGAAEIVIGSTQRRGIAGSPTFDGLARIMVYRGNGTLVWQQTVNRAIMSSPAVGDLDGDGSLEVVVSYGADAGAPAGPGGVAAFRASDGLLLWNFEPHDRLEGVHDGYPDGVYSTPALGDVDGDGTLEVAFGAWDRTIYLLDASGKKRWEYNNLDTVWSSAAIADLDNDGLAEIIIGGDASYDSSGQTGSINGGFLYIFDGEGQILHKRYFDQVFYSSPVVADLNNDGLMEIIVGTGRFFNNSDGTENRGNYILNLDQDLNIRWQPTTNFRVSSMPAVADLDNDGLLEVIVTGEEINGGVSPGYTILAVYNAAGTQLWSSYVLDFLGNRGAVVYGSPTVADLTGDGFPEITAATNWEFAVFDRNGNQFTDTNGSDSPNTPTYLANYPVLNTLALGDIDGDGTIEMVGAGTHQCDVDHGYLYAWESPGTTNANSPRPWPQMRGNPRKTGWFKRPQANDAEVVSHTIPAVLPPGKSIVAQITMRNTGTTTWTAAGGYQLGAWGDSDPFTSQTRVALPGSVAPGETATFFITLTGATAGYAVSDWRMVQDGGAGWFGAQAYRKVKVGDQPAFYILEASGLIHNGGLAIPMPSMGNWGFSIARGLQLTDHQRGAYTLFRDGYVGSSGYELPGLNVTLGNAPLILSSSIPNLLAKEIKIEGSVNWTIDGYGNVYLSDGPPPITPLPPVASTDIARSFILTADKRGIYVLRSDGTLVQGGTATAVTPTWPATPGQETYVRIKSAPTGTGFYVLDRYGQVYAANGAPALPAASGVPFAAGDIVDIELLAHGKGYYLLASNGAIYAGGTAEPISVNPVEPWQVDQNSGKIAVDLVLADNRTYDGLLASSGSLSIMLEPNQSDDATLLLTGGQGSTWSWSAVEDDPSDILSLSSASGTTPGTVIFTLSSAGKSTGTYNATVTFNTPGSPSITVSVRLVVVQEVRRVYLPVTVR
ncbi:MAG: hypothetical protein KatS3mg057_2661 [Herpetosiphonaceae bacterium]|nr:MAG: hypothetical protein KatS3mg057_2661 [Herpetosiphonaceae bacterium]